MLSGIKTFYINLDHRTDRKEDIENFLKSLEISNVTRIPGVIREPSWSGIVYAFHNAFTEANKTKPEETKNNMVLVVEDDCFLKNMDNFYINLDKFFKNIKHEDWDVLLLGGNNVAPLKQKFDGFCKINKTYGCPAYLTKIKYAGKIADAQKISMKFIEKNKPENITTRYTSHANDVIIGDLQKKDNWYIIFPDGVNQRPGYSDNSKTYMDHTMHLEKLKY